MRDANGKQWPGLYLKDGVIYMRIKNRAGKWVGRSTQRPAGEEKDADRIRRKTMSALDAEAEIAPDGVPITVRRYGERWIKKRYERALPSAKDDESRLNRYVYPTFGEHAVDRGSPTTRP